MDDLDLALLCADRDEEAWTIFLSRYSGFIHTAIKRTFLKYRQEARPEVLEDIFGEVLLLLLEGSCKKLRGFEGRNGSSLSTYLWVLASRITVDHLRKEKTSPSFNYGGDGPLHNAADMRELPGEAFERRQLDEMVARVIGGLSAKDKLFIKLHYEEGLSTEEIAGIFKVSPGTVYSMKNRTREKMQKIFRKEFQEKPSY